MSESPFPAWAAVGREVALGKRVYGSIPRLVKVERHPLDSRVRPLPKGQAMTDETKPPTHADWERVYAAQGRLAMVACRYFMMGAEEEGREVGAKAEALDEELDRLHKAIKAARAK